MSEGVQATDSRLTALIRVVHAAQLMGDRSTSLVSFEAFNHDVHAVERCVSDLAKLNEILADIR